MRYALIAATLLLVTSTAEADIRLAELTISHESLTTVINHHGIPGPLPPTELRFSFRLWSGNYGACCSNSFQLVRSVSDAQIGRIETMGPAAIAEISAVLELAITNILGDPNQVLRAMYEGGSFDSRFTPSPLPTWGELASLLANPGMQIHPLPNNNARAVLYVPLTKLSAHPISRVEWRVDDWRIKWTPGQYGSAGGRQTLFIFGAVPEPATRIPLLAAFAFFLARHRAGVAEYRR